MFDVYHLACESISDGHFSNVEMTELLGDIASMGPLDGTLIVIVQWLTIWSGRDVGQLKVFHQEMRIL